MTKKTVKRSAEVHIVEDYDTGETTIRLRMFKNKIFYTDYVLDSVDVYEKNKKHYHTETNGERK